MARLFRKILVPHDFSEPATAALRVAADLAAGWTGRITVLHVVVPYVAIAGVPPMNGAVWTPPPDLADDKRRLSALVARTLRGRRVRVACEVILGDPYQRIVAAARRHDSIVMATEGRTGLSHLLIGSVAEKVVRHATVPVLIVRPTAARRAGRAGSARRRRARAARRRR